MSVQDRRPRRIFWFGAHKVLKATELRDLRALGHEVFNPAYISPVYDQSADLRVDIDQPTTLPDDVFHQLLAHDFFYKPVPPRIADLLNSWFDVVIVTINPDWLAEVLSVYRGQLIYRVYGQHYILSETLIANKAFLKILERDNFSIVPFAHEAIAREHGWFLDRCDVVVPYQLPDDVFAWSGRWSERDHRPEIATSLPNIQNPYYAERYAEFDAAYPHRVIRIYGPQRETPPDSRIVGGLDRQVFLDRLAGSAGYIYNYTDDVCYLPPIEMMEVGGPVIYAPGSLLSRFYSAETPGLITSALDAERKLRWLLSGDKEFVREVVASQEPVRQRYDRAIVRPKFAAAFSKLLDPATQAKPALTFSPSVLSGPAQAPSPASLRRIYFLLHVDGLLVHRNGQAFAVEGIPRVVDMIVAALSAFGDFEIVVTCTDHGLAVFHDFFREPLRAGRLKLHIVRTGRPTETGNQVERLLLAEALNRRDDIVAVVVPHYYLFPEALLFVAPLILYLPDYFPHVMPGVVFDASAEKDQANKAIGLAIAKKSRFILTNSTYTKSYLPAAGFVTEAETAKVVVAPLPLLGEDRAAALATHELARAREAVGGERFIFYPTANRPNKQFAFLLKVFARLRIDHPDLKLVLTGDLRSVPGVWETAEALGLLGHIVSLPQIEEGVLQWLYQNAAALCLTSTLEGNFPPQVLEAMTYGTPLVATRLPTIEDLLGDHAESLLLCRPLDREDFVEKLERAMTDRQAVLARQAGARDRLAKATSRQQFFDQFQAAMTQFVLNVGEG